MTIQITQEKTAEYKKVENIIEEAFRNAEHTDHTEHQLVARLRKSQEFVPELSLVAKENNKLIGHILFSECQISGHKSLALAPVSVTPEYQGKGIGAKLVREGLRIAKESGYTSVIVLGHADYYPRFGFEKASKYGIKAPFEVPDEVFMALELVEDGLKGVSGVVEYSPAFLG